LWAEVFGEPPSIAAEADLLYEVLLRCLPPAPPYGEAWRARGSDQAPAEGDAGEPPASSLPE
jgi:hypothetical protein